MRWPLRNIRISQGYSAAHPANDLAASSGTTIYAPDNGVVTLVNDDADAYFGGKYVVIYGDSGYRFYMGHNSSNSVKVGQRVKQGQVIGKVGATGRATGPHIHFQMSKDGKTVDPSKVIKKGDSMAEPKVSLEVARILAHGVLGRNGVTSKVNALSGKSDADLKKHHVGKKLNSAYIRRLYNSREARKSRRDLAKLVKAGEAEKKLDKIKAIIK